MITPRMEDSILDTADIDVLTATELHMKEIFVDIADSFLPLRACSETEFGWQRFVATAIFNFMRKAYAYALYLQGWSWPREARVRLREAFRLSRVHIKAIRTNDILRLCVTEFVAAFPAADQDFVFGFLGWADRVCRLSGERDWCTGRGGWRAAFVRTTIEQAQDFLLDKLAKIAYFDAVTARIKLGPAQ